MKPPLELNPFARSPTTRTRYVPPIDDALRPSFEALKKSLRLGECAREAGAENFPRTTDKDWDEPQRQVRAATQASVNLSKQWIANQMNGAEAKIKALGLSNVDTELALTRAGAEASKAKLAAAEALEEARLQERLRLRGWRKFRRDNGLTGRKAAYADVIAWPFVVTGGLVLVDGVANAGLYMNAVDGGLVAGGGMAIMFSTVNVALGFGAGFFGLRLLGHVKPLTKLAGTGLFAGFFGSGVFWNMVVAKYRDDLAHGAVGGLLHSAAGLAEPGWVGHASPEALGLMFIGGLVYLFSILKGRGGHNGFVDPFWSYKQVDLDHRRADEAYKAEKHAYRSAVAAAYQNEGQFVRNLHAANDAAVKIARQVANEAEERAKEVRDTIGEWLRQGGAALRFYREENCAVRTTPPPTYFNDYPTFEEMAQGLADATAVRAACDQVVAVHDKAAAEITAFERQLALEEESETTRFLDEVAEIEQRADARLAADFSDKECPIDDGPGPAPAPSKSSPSGPAPAGASIN